VALPITSSAAFCSQLALRKSLSSVLDRREERAERRTAHIAALRKRAAETEAKLKRLYDAIENDDADLADSMLKYRIAELKTTRDQARADAERAEGAGSTNLATGRHAVIEGGLGFSLMSWQPVLDQPIGRRISGRMRDDGEVE
jgi:hypothetical protein